MGIQENSSEIKNDYQLVNWNNISISREQILPVIKKPYSKEFPKPNFLISITRYYEPLNVPVITAPNMGKFLIEEIQHYTGLSIEKIAVLSDISISSIRRIAKNQNKYPHFVFIRKLLVAYCLLTQRVGETFKCNEAWTVSTLGIRPDGVVVMEVDIKWWIDEPYPERKKLKGNIKKAKEIC